MTSRLPSPSLFTTSTHLPYNTVGFVNVPWTALLLAPFGLIPLELSTLIQTIFYFLYLTVLVKRMGGSLRHVLLALTPGFSALRRRFVDLEVILENF